ncbi:MAG: RagB/SusD family nutrient uptake outer membrane protein, partial [Bacteroidetes bacterium]
MKKIIAITGLLVALVFTACEDRFDKDPLSLITSQNMWSTESEARAGITGMYSRFRSTFNTETFLIWFEFRSGFWKVGASGAGQWDDLFLNTPNATSTPSTNWNDIYRVIGAANLALKYIPEIDFSDDDVKNTLLADAYFVRAFCYFALGRIWGDVPLIITPIESLDDENLYSSRSDVDLVFELVKDDIDQALTL